MIVCIGLLFILAAIGAIANAAGSSSARARSGTSVGGDVALAVVSAIIVAGCVGWSIHLEHRLRGKHPVAAAYQPARRYRGPVPRAVRRRGRYGPGVVAFQTAVLHPGLHRPRHRGIWSSTERRRDRPTSRPTGSPPLGPSSASTITPITAKARRGTRPMSRSRSRRPSLAGRPRSCATRASTSYRREHRSLFLWIGMIPVTPSSGIAGHQGLGLDRPGGVCHNRRRVRRAAGHPHGPPPAPPPLGAAPGWAGCSASLP